jgi:dTDP-4-amino-4,6-dideoxygalactose transaminase
VNKAELGPVPMLDLERQHGPIHEALQEAMARVMASGGFVGGPEVEAFEAELAAWHGVPHCVGVANGTDALVVAFKALGIGPGDEVVTAAVSFFATAEAISLAGAVPVFCDIHPRAALLDTAGLESCITPRTRAVVPVHLYGQPVDMDAVAAVARRHGLAVVEDCAQAIGATWRGRKVGTFGDLAAFSFYPSKNLGAFGDAGALLTRDATLAGRCRQLANHGGSRKYEHNVVGMNSRLDALQAAVLRVKLPHLESWTAGRQRNAARYRALFQEAGLSDRVTLPCEAPQRTHIYNQFNIRVRERDALKAHLDRAGIGTEIYYPVPFHLQACYASLGYAAGAFPEAEAAARESLALPIYPELTEAQQAEVVGAITAFFRR